MIASEQYAGLKENKINLSVSLLFIEKDLYFSRIVPTWNFLGFYLMHFAPHSHLRVIITCISEGRKNEQKILQCARHDRRQLKTAVVTGEKSD